LTQEECEKRPEDEHCRNPPNPSHRFCGLSADDNKAGWRSSLAKLAALVEPQRG